MKVESREKSGYETQRERERERERLNEKRKVATMQQLSWEQSVSHKCGNIFSMAAV